MVVGVLQMMNWWWHWRRKMADPRI